MCFVCAAPGGDPGDFSLDEAYGLLHLLEGDGPMPREVRFTLAARLLEWTGAKASAFRCEDVSALQSFPPPPQSETRA